MSARVTTVSAFPDMAGMSAYPDFPLFRLLARSQEAA